MPCLQRASRGVVRQRRRRIAQQEKDWRRAAQAKWMCGSWRDGEEPLDYPADGKGACSALVSPRRPLPWDRVQPRCHRLLAVGCLGICCLSARHCRKLPLCSLCLPFLACQLRCAPLRLLRCKDFLRPHAIALESEIGPMARALAHREGANALRSCARNYRLGASSHSEEGRLKTDGSFQRPLALSHQP